MRIAILVPMVWSVRNVLHAGVLRALKGLDVEAHLLVRRWDDASALGVREDPALLDDAAGVHPLLDAPAQTPRGKALLDALLTSAFQQQHANRSHAIYRRWFSRHHGPLLRARGALVELGGWLAASSPHATRMLERVVERLARRGRDLGPVRDQLRQLDPDLIWSTVNVSALEWPYRLAARDLGIPIAASILSFDNLTSRGPLARDQHYLVWGARMRQQLLRLYPDLESRQVSITGTPQFDFHRRPSCLWTRQRTLRALGLPLGARYFLYGASHAMLTPGEPALVGQLARRMGERRALDGRALVVRLHPLDDGTRWAAQVGGALMGEGGASGIQGSGCGRVRISPALSGAGAGAGGAADGWAVPSQDDHARLTSSLVHADGCLNIASTLSLDAAILDRPVICLDFTAESSSPRDILYAEYGAEHYAPLVASGGVRVAHSWHELLGLMEAAIDRPERDRDRRARMVAQECGPVDGRSAERVAHVLTGLARAAQRARRGNRRLCGVLDRAVARPEAGGQAR